VPRPDSVHPPHRDQAWVSWAEAAEIVGCPVSTVEHHVRTGRIERRPFDGSRPTLRLSSVVEFAHWFHCRRQRLDKEATRREAQRTNENGVAGDMLNTEQAAAQLGVSASMVSHLTRTGQLQYERHDGRHWYAQADVDDLAERRRRPQAHTGWLTYREAAAAAGCSEPTIAYYVRQGRIDQREVPRRYPSLREQSVAEFARWWAHEQVVLRRAREDRQAHVAEREATPDAAVVWLSSAEVAIMLSVTRAWVRLLGRADRLPATVHRHRLWFQRQHIEQYIAARAAERSRRIARPSAQGSPDRRAQVNVGMAERPALGSRSEKSVGEAPSRNLREEAVPRR